MTVQSSQNCTSTTYNWQSRCFVSRKSISFHSMMGSPELPQDDPNDFNASAMNSVSIDAMDNASDASDDSDNEPMEFDYAGYQPLPGDDDLNTIPMNGDDDLTDDPQVNILTVVSIGFGKYSDGFFIHSIATSHTTGSDTSWHSQSIHWTWRECLECTEAGNVKHWIRFDANSTDIVCNVTNINSNRIHSHMGERNIRRKMERGPIATHSITTAKHSKSTRIVLKWKRNTMQLNIDV